MFHSSPHPPYFLLSVLSSLPRRSRSHREPSSSVRANYTCANQPASDEAGPVALSLHRGFNHSCPQSSEPGWSMELFSVARHAVALLNYAEALTSFRPTLVQQPFSRGPCPLIGFPPVPSFSPEKTSRLVRPAPSSIIIPGW